MGKPNRQKHNYTSELELKSLLIRIKNKRNGVGTDKDDTKINKYIKWHTVINNKKYADSNKRNRVKNKLKTKIVELSELSKIGDKSYERFGQIILLMVKNILKKPQFSGYTYRDDFYSDAIYKILKYLGNFDHKLISDRTNQPVNSFAYISQIIHNSILFIINTKKKENDQLKRQVGFENVNHNLQIKNSEIPNQSTYDGEDNEIIETIELKSIKTTLVDEIKKLSENIERVTRLNVYYPKNYRISFEEYNELKPLLKGKLSIIRKTA